MSLIPPLEMARFPPSNVLHTQLQLHHQMLYRQHNITHHHHHHPEEITNNGWLLPPTPGAGPTLPGDVTVSLQNAKLWQQFHAETTEMIITKLGRRMFPSLQLQIDGLERRARYCLLLEIAPASRRRHKYVGGGGENGGPLNSRGWTSAGPAEPQPHVNRRVYLHPDSPATGTHWMQHPVSFNKLKLTNNAVDHHSNVVLTSMHKYVPRIWIVRCDDISRLTSLFSQPASSFCFPETEFIAVTAYQNENITKLKIDNNPFAKGFRETGQSRCKRKMQTFGSSDSETILEDGNRLDNESSYNNDDDESNTSSSESESNRYPQRLDESLLSQRVKRAASETGSLDDSGVSSSGSASPPLVIPKQDCGGVASQPRLHRPWTDDDDEGRSATKSNETPVQNRRQNLTHSNNQIALQPQSKTSRGPVFPNQMHFSHIEFARIQQIQQIQQIQHYQKIQYEQYCQINQLKNIGLHLPFASTTHPRLHPYQSPRSKYGNFDIHSPVGIPPSPSPAHSPAVSTDGAFASS